MNIFFMMMAKGFSASRLSPRFYSFMHFISQCLSVKFNVAEKIMAAKWYVSQQMLVKYVAV